MVISAVASRPSDTTEEFSMKFFRKDGWIGVVLMTCLIGGCGLAMAQERKGPITLVVGYPPGGSADIGARILAEKLPAILGQSVVVDNRSGAGGQIAARLVRSAPSNGSVLFFTNGHTVVTVPRIFKVPGFDTMTDFKPVGTFASFEFALAVHPKTQVHSVQELVAYFARTPAERSIAVPAPGSAPEFMVGRLAQLTRSDVQSVAYRGAAPAVQDLLGGQVAAAILPVADILPYLKAGRLQAIAVTQATALLPNVPAFADMGLGELAASDFLAVYAPVGVSDDNVARVNAAIQKVLAMPDVSERIRSYAMQPLPGSPDDLRSRYLAASKTVGALMKAVDYQPQ
jgi:tripartite-type tricarboxylate transporter receptor subunit TctC